MKNVFKLSLFTLSVILSSNAMAATGSGHAQAELTNPLSILSQSEVDFGSIAIDPGAGPQVLSMDADGNITCPATYVCSGDKTSSGELIINGAPDAAINIDITGVTATLDDGSGNTLTFDPEFTGAVDSLSSILLDNEGEVGVVFGGSINFTGNELAGEYLSSQGEGFQVTVNY